jgi:RimJ/RimL family protein N-acetyltransferase
VIDTGSGGETQGRVERVTLTPLKRNHLLAVRRWRSDAEVTRYWITQHVPTFEELKDWLRQNQMAGSVTLAILDETNAPIGYADVFNIDEDNRKCEIALMIGERERWGRGYAREALTKLLERLFSDSGERGAGMHKVTLAVFAENEAARRLYRACGFREDGVLREDIYRDGRWHDQILMSILDFEFDDSRSARVPGSESVP